MGLQHIRRFTPPWAAESGTTFCGRKIRRTIRLITVEECHAALARAAGLEQALPGMPIGAIPDRLIHIGDSAFTMICREAEACQPCVKDIPVMRSWQQDPVRCLSQHAHFMTCQRDPAVAGQWLAEIFTIARLITEHQQHYDETVIREKALVALRGLSG